MSAPQGNQFWKLRSKHGRDKIFSTPEVLWEAATEYFETTDGRKWIKTEFNGKDAKECYVPTSVPYTQAGLFVFLDIDRKTWDLYAKREEFIPVVTRIEQIIFAQKFEGAAVGAYNANIIARDLGLVDKKDGKTEGKIDVVVSYEDRNKAAEATPEPREGSQGS